MDYAKISVLIRTKNRHSFLQRCLRYIAQQSYQNFRIYILNDGGDKGGGKNLRHLLTIFQ